MLATVAMEVVITGVDDGNMTISVMPDAVVAEAGIEKGVFDLMTVVRLEQCLFSVAKI